MSISKLEFLAQVPLFAEMDADDLEDLAAIFEELEYTDDAIVAYQRDIADGLHILKSGRLYAKTVERGVVTHARHYLPGDYFGLAWLFAPNLHPATIQAASRDDNPARLLVLRSRPFLQYLSAHQHVIDDLAPVYDASDSVIAGFPEEAYAQALKVRARRDRRSSTMNVLPDELVEFMARRSGWYLLLELLPPLVLWPLVTIPPYIYLARTQPDSVLYTMQFWCPAVLSLLFLAWALFLYLDWTNDYFLVTTRRVIHREFNLRAFRVDIKVARIDQIQSVAVEKPNLITNLFNYGTVRIATASQYGIILFDHINNPQRVTEIMDRLTRLVRTLDASREQTLVRQSIDEYFEFDPPYERIDAEEAATAVPLREPPPGLWSRFFRRYRWRVEEDGVITYHRHFLVAAAAIIWPVLISVLTTVFAYLIIRFNIMDAGILFPVLAVLYLLLLGWIVWQLEDWRNNVYQLDGRFIIDIDRVPFGFGESRKQAGLQNIQNVKAYTPNLIHTIFNYGYVEVETAGVDSDIMFEDVPFPAIVQSDIFQQIEDLRQRQRDAEEARRHKAFAVLLDVYKQEEEQGRLLRRTPYPLSPEELDEEEL